MARLETVLERWGLFVARHPLPIILVWIALVGAAWIVGPAFEAVAQKEGNLSSLPASALSVQADHLYATKFAAGRAAVGTETDLIVLTDPQGITGQDVARMKGIEAWLTAAQTRPAQLLKVTGPDAQMPAKAFESPDQQAIVTILTWDIRPGLPSGSALQSIIDHLAQQPVAAGGSLGLTGTSPIEYELGNSIFGGGSAGTLLGLLIILLVLGLVYRSPLAVIIPLLTVVMAAGLAIPLIAWLGQSFDLPVATFSLQFLIFVLLGAGTNYGVFLLSRYKEELGHEPVADRSSRMAALARAIGRVGESITSSAVTVVLAMAIMGFAQYAVLRVTGPAVAIGVALLLLAGLSLLPALMSLSGRALFWPVQVKPASREPAEGQGFWARAGRMVTAHPWAVALATIVVLAPLAISCVTLQLSFDDLRSLPTTSTIVQAADAYQTHFHTSDQLHVLIDDPHHDLRQPRYHAAIAEVARALAQVPQVTLAPTAEQAPVVSSAFAVDGSAADITVALDAQPSSVAARQAVDALYAQAAQARRGTALAGARIMIAGQSSTVRDEALQIESDFTRVVALVCIVIYVILALLVRSLTAPIYLLATIALSTLAAVGLTNIVYHDVLGQPLFAIVPIFAFVFLVSLGEDFNILTFARVREEVRKFGQRKGIAIAVATTGGVVSSCGLVMAASFSRLATKDILEVAEIGFTVVVGILVDTFVVRPLLVPALATILGRWNWVWPGRSLK